MKVVSVALGGGGSRGLAHLGALQVLEEEGIEISSVSGISAGAITGARWCIDPNAAYLSLNAIELLSSPEFRRLRIGGMMLAGANEERTGLLQTLRSLVRRGLHLAHLARRSSVVEEGILEELITLLVGEGDFSDCRVPFQAVALDLKEARLVTLREGPLLPAITASCALPGIFPPVEIDAMQLIDAGAVSSVPVAAARIADPNAVVLAIDPSRRLLASESRTSGVEVIQRVAGIARNWLTEQELTDADLVVRPRVGQRTWSDLNDLASVVESGRVAMQAAMPQLLELVEA